MCVSVHRTLTALHPVCQLGKKDESQPRQLKSATFSLLLLFKAVSFMAPFQTLPSGLKGTCCLCVWGWVSYFFLFFLFLFLYFLTARLNMNMFQSSAKQRKETNSEEQRNIWDILKNRHLVAHHVPVISLFLSLSLTLSISTSLPLSRCSPYSHVR